MLAPNLFHDYLFFHCEQANRYFNVYCINYRNAFNSTFHRQTEQYFQAMFESSKRWSGPGGMVGRKELVDKSKELRQRQKWLVNFSAQVSFIIIFFISR